MVLSIYKYNLEDVKKILEDIQKNKVKIVESPHFISRANSKKRKKYCEPFIVHKILKTKEPIDVEYSNDNKFRIKYDHIHIETYYIIIVIFIVNKNEIRLITTHPERKK
nr:hypothetical protein [Methanobrevibacter arboriphilus]